MQLPIFPRSDLFRLCLLGIALLGLRALIMAVAGFELHFDEAQYWEWSRRLDWSYYSKGPLTAWLIALSTFLFGHGEWQVRLFAWLAYALWLGVLFYFAREVWHSRTAGWRAVLLGLTVPVYFVLGEVMSSDVFLFLGWTIALWAAFRALYRERPDAWYVFGAAIGIGALAKLSIGLLPFFLGFFLLLTRGGRQALATRQFWGGLGLLFIFMSPVWCWNAHHDWVMFRHELGHVGGVAGSYRLTDIVDFIAGQWLALSPVVALLWIAAVWRPPREAEQRLLWGLSWLVLGFFLLKALHAKVQPNWPAPAYIGLLVLFAGQMAYFSRWQWRVLYGGIVFYFLLLVVVFFPSQFGIPGDKDPLKKLKHWREPVTALARQLPEADFVLAPYYHLSTELAFYWPRPLTVYLADTRGGRRMNQYDLWPGAARETGRNGAFVSTADFLPLPVQQAFAACRAVAPIPARTADGRVLRTLYGWACEDYRGGEWVKPSYF